MAQVIQSMIFANWAGGPGIIGGMDLRSALRLPPGACLALVGAGGKTTAMFQLARQFYPLVFTSATTHLGAWQLAQADQQYLASSPADIDALAQHRLDGVVLVSGPVDETTQRAAGLDPETLARLWQAAQERGAPLLVEADGARGLPLKAPAPHEPAIPPFAGSVLVVAGLAGLGQALDAAHVHRPERFAELAGLPAGSPITPDGLARVLLSEQVGLKGIPPGARRLALLTGAPEQLPQAQAVAQALARRLLPVYAAAVYSCLPGEAQAVYEPTAGILLAAGGSLRMGRPKLLLEWQGEPLVRRAAKAALQAGLAPLVVVTGAYEVQVRAAFEGLPVVFAHNPAWKSGQGSSVQAGIRQVPANCGAAIFLLGDQPFLSAGLLQALQEAQAQERRPVLAPFVSEQRSNPVLFDRSLFDELLQLQGEQGARSLFGRYPPARLPWPDQKILLDIDTPEDYQRLLEGNGV